MAVVLRGGLARCSVAVIAPRQPRWSDVSWLGVCRWITSDRGVFVSELVVADLIVPVIFVPVIVVPVVLVPVVLVRMLSNVDVGQEVVDGAFGRRHSRMGMGHGHRQMAGQHGTNQQDRNHLTNQGNTFKPEHSPSYLRLVDADLLNKTDNFLVLFTSSLY